MKKLKLPTKCLEILRLSRMFNLISKLDLSDWKTSSEMTRKVIDEMIAGNWEQTLFSVSASTQTESFMDVVDMYHYAYGESQEEIHICLHKLETVDLKSDTTITFRELFNTIPFLDWKKGKSDTLLERAGALTVFFRDYEIVHIQLRGTT